MCTISTFSFWLWILTSATFRYSSERGTLRTHSIFRAKQLMPPPATLLQSHDTSYMLKRGWASEKSSQPTSCIHLHTFIILRKLVPQKTFDSLIAHLRLIPVYGSSWMYKIFKKNSSVVLSFPQHTAPLWSQSSASLWSLFSPDYYWRCCWSHAHTCSFK